MMVARARFEEVYNLLATKSCSAIEKDLDVLHVWIDEIITELTGMPEPEDVKGLARELCNSYFHLAYIAANHIKHELHKVKAVSSVDVCSHALGRAREAAFFGALALGVLGAPSERDFEEAASQALEEGAPFIPPAGNLCGEVDE